MRLSVSLPFSPSNNNNSTQHDSEYIALVSLFHSQQANKQKRTNRKVTNHQRKEHTAHHKRCLTHTRKFVQRRFPEQSTTLCSVGTAIQIRSRTERRRFIPDADHVSLFIETIRRKNKKKKDQRKKAMTIGCCCCCCCLQFSQDDRSSEQRANANFFAVSSKDRINVAADIVHTRNARFRLSTHDLGNEEPGIIHLLVKSFPREKKLPRY